jgi:hypothetical protein
VRGGTHVDLLHLGAEGGHVLLDGGGGGEALEFFFDC